MSHFTILSYSIKLLPFTGGLNLALASVLMMYHILFYNMVCLYKFPYFFVLYSHPSSVIKVELFKCDLEISTV